ncbi:unnamed protein product [Prunus armeniaca]
MTGPPSSSYPGQVSPPTAVISPENEEKSSGFDRNFAGFVLLRPATDSGKMSDLRIGFRPDFEGRFRPLPGVLPRVGVLSRDLWFSRRWVIALDTHALPAHVAARGHCSRGAFLSQWDPQVVMSA